MIKWWVIVKSSKWIHDLWKDGTYATHISPCLNSNSLRDLSFVLEFLFFKKEKSFIKKEKEEEENSMLPKKNHLSIYYSPGGSQMQ